MAKRRVSKEKANRISLAALAAWDAGERAALHRALGLGPWQASPLDCVGACPWPPGTAGAVTWEKSASLRAELIEAAAGQ